MLSRPSRFLIMPIPPRSTLFPYTTLFRSDKGKDTRDYLAAAFPELNAWERAGKECRSEERFSRNAETDLVCRLLLEKKKNKKNTERSELVINGREYNKSCVCVSYVVRDGR